MLVELTLEDGTVKYINPDLVSEVEAVPLPKGIEIGQVPSVTLVTLNSGKKHRVQGHVAAVGKKLGAR